MQHTRAFMLLSLLTVEAGAGVGSWQAILKAKVSAAIESLQANGQNFKNI